MVGIIEGVDVTGRHLFARKTPEHLFDGGNQATKVDRDRRRLCDDVAVGIEDRRRSIQAFLDDRRICRPQERVLHLIGDCSQTMPQHFKQNSVKLPCVCHESLLRAPRAGDITPSAQYCSRLSGNGVPGSAGILAGPRQT